MLHVSSRLSMLIRFTCSTWCCTILTIRPTGNSVSNIELQGTGNATTTFKTGSVTFDLLALVSVTKMLGNDTVPVGNYTMIRFTIVSAVATVGGSNVSMTVPSGQVKVPTQFQIASGKTTTIVLEINPGQIEISASNNLRPVVTPHVSGPSWHIFH